MGAIRAVTLAERVAEQPNRNDLTGRAPFRAPTAALGHPSPPTCDWYCHPAPTSSQGIVGPPTKAAVYQGGLRLRLQPGAMSAVLDLLARKRE